MSIFFQYGWRAPQNKSLLKTLLNNLFFFTPWAMKVHIHGNLPKNINRKPYDIFGSPKRTLNFQAVLTAIK